MEQKRLNKAISETGICSRRAADKLIEEGKVLINGCLAELGTRVSENDEIRISGNIITKEVENIYLAFNKPVGVTCTTDTAIKGNIISYINYSERIFPVGRLDKPSEGLIIMTNDGDIVNKILRSGNNHEKEYIVTVHKKITVRFVERMANGVPILDTITKRCSVKKIGERQFNIVLTQGLNRQIRRMCEHLGYNVISLRRVRIMNITMGKLKKGSYRRITKAELENMQLLMKYSVKTKEAS
jgi:23S rRNA pseudouridine2604 synthase